MVAADAGGGGDVVVVAAGDGGGAAAGVADGVGVDVCSRQPHHFHSLPEAVESQLRQAVKVVVVAEKANKQHRYNIFPNLLSKKIIV